METTKDVKAFFNRLAEEAAARGDKPILSTFEECSMNGDGKSGGSAMVNTKKACYNFDAIAKRLFPDNPPCSVDCIYISEKTIDFIEFKGGFFDKYQKDYQEPGYPCPECRKLHRERFDYFKKTRKQQKEILYQSIQNKAADSLLLMQNCILPRCEDTETRYSLRFICVYGLDTVDPVYALEQSQSDLAKDVEGVLKKSLHRYEQEEAEHTHPFYDAVEVISNVVFQAKSFYR